MMTDQWSPILVMAGLDPAIQGPNPKSLFAARTRGALDGRIKCGHDGCLGQGCGA